MSKLYSFDHSEITLCKNKNSNWAYVYLKSLDKAHTIDCHDHFIEYFNSYQNIDKE